MHEARRYVHGMREWRGWGGVGCIGCTECMGWVHGWHRWSGAGCATITHQPPTTVQHHHLPPTHQPTTHVLLTTHLPTPPLTPGDLSSLKGMLALTWLDLRGCSLITGTVAVWAHGRVDGGS